MLQVPRDPAVAALARRIDRSPCRAQLRAFFLRLAEPGLQQIQNPAEELEVPLAQLLARRQKT